MKPDIDIIRDMLDQRKIGYKTEFGSKLHINGAVLTFDSIGRLANADPDEEGIEEMQDHIDELEEKVETLQRKINRAIEELE